MKIRIRKRPVYPLESVFFFFTLFFVSSYALLENVSISIPVFSVVKMPLLYAGGICILPYILSLLRMIKKKKYFYVMAAVFLFCLMLEVAALVNRSPRIGSDPQRATTRLILYLVELFLLMIWAAESDRSQFVIHFLFYYVLILTIATDVLIFIDKEAFGVSAAGLYLVGTKFTVAYFHINLFVLWFCRNRERFFKDRKARRVIYIGLPIILYISIYVDCMTGVLSCIALLILFLLMNTSKASKLLKLTSPVFLLIILLASFAFPFLANGIVSVPAIRNLLNSVLNRSSTLSGRLDIYQQFLPAMENQWAWGYGFGNANVVSMVKFGYANAQNAILQWILQTGIPATLLFVALMLVIVHRLNRSNAVMRSMPLLMLVYVYVIIGTVEITYSMGFLLWFALIFMLSGSAIPENKGTDSPLRP